MLLALLGRSHVRCEMVCLVEPFGDSWVGAESSIRRCFSSAWKSNGVVDVLGAELFVFEGFGALHLFRFYEAAIEASVMILLDGVCKW